MRVILFVDPRFGRARVYAVEFDCGPLIVTILRLADGVQPQLDLTPRAVAVGAGFAEQRGVNLQIACGATDYPVLQPVSVAERELDDLGEVPETGPELGGDPGADHIDDADVLIEGSPGFESTVPSGGQNVFGAGLHGDQGACVVDLVGGGLKLSTDGSQD